jgi:hypothetical protein
VTGGAGLPRPPVEAHRPGPPSGGGWPPHDTPSAAELLDAVREFLETDVLSATVGRLQFHVRVAANVVGIVGRELTLGPAQAQAHADRLRSLGVADEAELAAAIRAGALAAPLAEVLSVVRATVADKLSVANPGYLAHAGRGVDAPADDTGDDSSPGPS